MKTIYTMLAIVALFISTAVGQQSAGGSAGPNRPTELQTVPTLGRLVIDMSGIILQTDLDRQAIQIRTKQNQREREMGFRLDPKCKIKADKKEFGKKELTLDELEPGYEVKLTVRRADMQIIEMKVKKPKDALPNG